MARKRKNRGKKTIEDDPVSDDRATADLGSPNPVPDHPTDAADMSDEDADSEHDPDDPNEPKYCYCNRGAYGEMVACDNEGCPREWFHMGCTGLKQAPGEEERWYCRECRPANEKGEKNRGGNRGVSAETGEGDAPGEDEVSESASSERWDEQGRPVFDWRKEYNKMQDRLAAANAQVTGSAEQPSDSPELTSEQPPTKRQKLRQLPTGPLPEELAGPAESKGNVGYELTLADTLPDRGRDKKVKAKRTRKARAERDEKAKAMRDEKMKADRAADPTCPTCGNCGITMPRGTYSRPGFNGGQICNRCYNQYKRKHGKTPKAHSSSKLPTVADVLGLGRSGRAEPDHEEGQEHEESDSGSDHSFDQDPRSSAADKGNSDAGVDKDSEDQDVAPLEKTEVRVCEDCDRREAQEWHASVCGHCHRRRQVRGAEQRMRNRYLPTFQRKNGLLTHAQLRSLAYRHFRILNPTDAFLADRGHIATARTDYWLMKRDELHREARLARGIHVGRGVELSDKITSLLQLDDAFNGILPRPRPTGASDLHRKSYPALVAMAKAMGEGSGDMSLSETITYLMKKKDPSTFIQKADPSALTALQLTVGDFLGSLPDLGNLHTTHNQGIVGARDALERLQGTVLDNFFPSWTSSIGFLCGPNALANALHATRRLHHYQPGNQIERLTSQMMMELLFTNADQTVTRTSVGMPTPEYQRYFAENFGHLGEAEQGHEHENMHRLNDLDIQQLVAILRLAHRHGYIEQDFSLGLVTSAYIDPLGRNVPARAQIVHQGAAAAPTVWLHLNIAAGAGEYNHFEGFEDNLQEHDAEAAYEWGLAFGWTNQVERTRRLGGWLESEVEKCQREVYNAKRRLTQAVSKMRKACKPCREREKMSTCKRLPGQRHCTNCETDELTCEWDEGTSLPNLPLSGKDVSEEDIHTYDTPMRLIHEEELMLQANNHLPPADMTSRHFTAIGAARMSSHPGGLSMAQVQQNLILTVNTYNNLLNNPLFANTWEGQRPGGQPALPMQRFHVVFARHGAMPVPTHLGNLQNLSLITFVNFIDYITRPNNPQIPEEIHFVLLGFAGFSVDVTGWGDRNHGFFKHVLDRGAAQGTNIAYRIYLVPVSELQVADPHSPSSINFGLPAHGIRHNNKRYMKFRLVHVVDRHEQLRAAATLLGLHFRVYMSDITRIHANLMPLNAGVIIPVWPANRGGMATAAYLDRFIMGMFWERMWRVAGLDNTTTPTAADVAHNNNNRNDAALP